MYFLFFTFPLDLNDIDGDNHSKPANLIEMGSH